MTATAASRTPTLPAPRPDRPLLKVCGLKYPANVAAVAALPVDMLGFIFASKSPRYAPPALDAAQLRALPVCKVGVFVDEAPAVIRRTALHFGLTAVQLHGQESAADCAALAAAGLPVLKAVGVGAQLDLERLAAYAPFCSYFIFDTAGPAAGGNGTAFDWELLRAYNLPTPYLLAGGLGPANAAALRGLQLPGLAGFDVNSRVEQGPGLKDIGLLRTFIDEVYG
ncbi:phosphoribosylanthranilate isomerase [Hymenobacter edaphi]|uniref:N-(5'-phosphoribosyl)anthranilate isomerase n=1 Tax=Hymenobacter edaphi TaxID=2211146 RepID=A0A328BQP2_9BACT|nr:phosphoribosylanthranilate isomerase [Hymenobacter edaphi]RAK69572.1 phosphoribosylanthranilate isomerase [Hymenobacter edaphi]